MKENSAPLAERYNLEQTREFFIYVAVLEILNDLKAEISEEQLSYESMCLYNSHPTANT